MGPPMALFKICKCKVDHCQSEHSVVPKNQLQPKQTSTNSIKSTPSKKQSPPKETPAVHLTPDPIDPNDSPEVPVTFAPDIEIFNEQYALELEIGKGAFGKVYSATRKSDNLKVAVKQMLRHKIKNWTTDPHSKRLIPTEVAMLHKCQGVKGVIRLIEYFESKTQALIVMERNPDFVDLFDFVTLSVKRKMSHPNARHVVRQITQTLAKCQSLGVIHRDLKQENVLIHKKKGNIKLLDFGLAQLVMDSNQRFKCFKGTAVYKPPEYIKSKSSFADSLTVWSIGCFTYSLLFGTVPFKTDIEIVAGVVSKEAQMRSLTNDSRDFILQCLKPNPESRPLLRDLINHPWIFSPSGHAAPPKTESAKPHCSNEVLQVSEQHRPSPSTSSSTNRSNDENEESRDQRIYLKLRRALAN